MALKKIINLLVPAINANYDVMIPGFMTISELVPLIAKAVEELSNGNYVTSGHEFLCHKELDLLLSQDRTLNDYEIQNGDHIFLI